MNLDTLALVLDSDPILARRMPHYDDFGDAAEKLSVALIAAMVLNDGIGLAANQVGLEIRAFSAIIAGTARVLFNPTITDLSDNLIKFREGCLSFPGLGLMVPRPEECQITFQDSAGDQHTLDLAGIDARCAMHEIDHLNGIVFTSKVSRLHLDMQKKKLRKKR